MSDDTALAAAELPPTEAEVLPEEAPPTATSEQPPPPSPEAAAPEDAAAPPPPAIDADAGSGDAGGGGADPLLAQLPIASPLSPANDPSSESKSFGEVSYASPSMASARALFAAPKPAAVMPARRTPSAAALKLGGGGAAKVEEAAPPPAEPAGPPITVYHKGVYYPLAELIAATRQNPGVFAGIDFSEKETLLNEESFRAVFGMPFEEFSAMGRWKRDLKKKEKGLF